MICRCFRVFFQVLKTLIIHCGKINDGHTKLTDCYNWEIIPIKNIYGIKLSDYRVIIIDETQRIFPGQLDYIISETKIYYIIT